MKQCPKCGQFTEDENDFCPNDGTRLPYDSKSEPTIFVNPTVPGQSPHPVQPSPNYFLYGIILMLAVVAIGFAAAFFWKTWTPSASSSTAPAPWATRTPASPGVTQTPVSTPIPPTPSAPAPPTPLPRLKQLPAIGSIVVSTTPYLILRASSTQKSDKLRNISPGEKMRILEYSAHTEYFEGKNERFARVEPEYGGTGWVYMGYVRPE